MFEKLVEVICAIGIIVGVIFYAPKDGGGMPDVPWPYLDEGDLEEMREEALKEWAHERGYR